MLTLKYIFLFVASTIVLVAIIVTGCTMFKKRMLYKRYGIRKRAESRRERRLRETQDMMFEEFDCKSQHNTEKNN